MLSIKRLPTLSASKIQSKIYSDFRHYVIENQINKQCPNSFVNLCRSFSLLHNYARKSNNPQLRHISLEYKAACALLRRSNLPLLTTVLKGSPLVKNIHTSRPLFNEKQNDDKKKKDKKKGEIEDNMPSLLLKAAFWMLTTSILVIASTLAMPINNNKNELIRYVSWHEFVHKMLKKGEVEEIIVRPDMDVVTIILYDGAIINGVQTPHRTYHMNVVDVQRFEEKLRETEKSLGVKEGVRVRYDRNSSVAGALITGLVIVAFIVAFLYSTKSMRMNMNLGGFSQLGRARFTLVDSMNGPGRGVKFADVAGLREAKVEIMEFVDYLKRPEHFKNLGAKVPKGALLLGPPGCGKTMLAKAVATESGVPFLSMNGSEFVEMIGGLGAARVRDLFKEANSRAPCIIYIDELDAVGRARSTDASSWGAGGGEGEQTLNQLLVEMDGMKNRDGVVVLASTNRPDVLDKALLRPGRFDRHILIDLPTVPERVEIFERHLKDIVVDPLPEDYVPKLAHMTPGFSGADIANVCNEAALHAARDRQATVTQKDLEYAIERVVGGTERRSLVMSAEEKKMVAYHEAGHALTSWLMKYSNELIKVSIVPRTHSALGYTMFNTADKKLFTKEELLDSMCMALGGNAAESVMFNTTSDGARNDLEKATKVAYALVRTYGMSRTVGLVSYPDHRPGSGCQYSQTLKTLIDAEAMRFLTHSFFRTEELIRTNVDKLRLIAEALLEKETLTYEEIKALIGPPRFPNRVKIDSAQFDTVLKNMHESSTTDHVSRAVFAGSRYMPASKR